MVDDGSTDDSVKNLGKIKDTRISIIKKTNGGVSSARNKGIEEAKFDYIGFLDADDAWKPDFLELIKKMIEKHPKAGAYCTAYDMRMEDGSLKPCYNYENFEERWSGVVDDYFKYELNGPLISASSVVIPKKVFADLGGFPLDIKRGEDLSMWIRIALNYNIAYYNQICATYFQEADNRACNKKAKLRDTAVYYAEEELMKAKESGYCTLYCEEYMIQRVISKARYFIEEGNRKEGRKLLYKYRHTKLNKKLLLKSFVISWIPMIIYEKIRRINRI